MEGRNGLCSGLEVSSGEGAGRGGEYGDWGLGVEFGRRGLGIDDGDWGE